MYHGDISGSDTDYSLVSRTFCSHNADIAISSPDYIVAKRSFAVLRCQLLDITQNSKRIHFSGIEDSSAEGYVDNILLGVGNENLKTNVVFADLPSASGILGQNGFFDLFIVKFDLTKEEMEIRTR